MVSIVILVITLVLLLPGCGTDNHNSSSSTDMYNTTAVLLTPMQRLGISIFKDESIVRFSFMTSDKMAVISFGKHVEIPGDSGTVYIDDMDICLNENGSSSHFTMIIHKGSNYAYLDVPLKNFTAEPFYINVHAVVDYMYKVQRTGEYTFKVLRCWTGRDLLAVTPVPYDWLRAFTSAAKEVAAWGSAQGIDLLVLSPGYSSKDWKRDPYKDPYLVYVTFGQQPERTSGDRVDILADPTLWAYWGERGRYINIHLLCDMKSINTASIDLTIKEIMEDIARSIVSNHLDINNAPFTFIHVIEDKWYGWSVSNSMSTSEMLKALFNASKTQYHDFNLRDIVEEYRREQT